MARSRPPTLVAAEESDDSGMASEYTAVSGAGNPRDGALRIDVVTLFPEMFVGPFDHSIVARARESGLLDLRVHNLRTWTRDRHRTTDDYAYGGGGGMVMKPGPLFRAVEDLLGIGERRPDAVEPLPAPVVLMSPQGARFDQALARRLAGHDRLVLLAGHYEGVDERVRQHLATHEVSVGDFVLTGGELPAMLVVDAVTRLRPGVLGSDTAAETDSFAAGLLEHAHYTRPADFRGWGVPEVLRSGHHAEVARWRRRDALRRTAARRPDLLAAMQLDAAERAWLEEEGLLP
jgi:tRNA (guanine37-N1)-methyltransferase